MTLTVPELPEDVDTLTAAFVYAKAGWYVLPADQATKNPGSVVGAKWQTKSSRDPEQLAAWFAGTNYALALHAGRSGAVIFDVDRPAAIPEPLRVEIGRVHPPFQSTRDNEPGRGHYIFAMPPGRSINNSGARLGKGWGEVRGKNGVVIVEPSHHGKDHGRYHWLTTGEVPMLGSLVADLLNDAGEEGDVATDAEVSAFLREHDGGDRPDLLTAITTALAAAFAQGESRHGALCIHLAWAAREARAGYFAATAAELALLRAFTTVMLTSRDGVERTLTPRRARLEFAGVLAWAVGQANAVDAGIIRVETEQRLVNPLANGAKRVSALVAASTIRFQRVRWGWDGRMPIGELTLIPGREGAGKSLFLAWLAAQITRGTLPGEFEGEPRSVLYVASEDSWSYTVGPRMAAAGADLDRIFRVEVRQEGVLAQVSLPLDCQRIAEDALSVKAAAIMLDPIISLVDDTLSVNQSKELRKALEPLRRAAEGADVIVAALAHFNKVSDTDVLSKIPGSRAWAEVARAVFGIAEDREQGCYVASQVKNNLGRLDLPHLAYRIDSVDLPTEGGLTNVGRLVWQENSEIGIEEVLARRPERKAREVSDRSREVIDWIEAQGYPASLPDIVAAFPDIKPVTIRSILHRAAERGDVSNPLRGHYGPSRS